MILDLSHKLTLCHGWTLLLTVTVLICWILIPHHGHIRRTCLKIFYPKCSDFQKQFETLSQHTGHARHPTFRDFSVRHGVLYLLDGMRSRVCVPTTLRGQLLETCHDSPLGGHVGTKKGNKSFNASTRDIPHPHDVPVRRFEVMSLDLLSGFPTSKNGYDCISFKRCLESRACHAFC
jgi:hypothetical protein